MPTSPAAPSAAPMFDLTLPPKTGGGGAPPWGSSPRCWDTARSSTASPTRLLLPSHSTRSTSQDPIPAERTASCKTSVSAARLGARNPASEPPWFSEVPASTPSRGSPSLSTTLSSMSSTSLLSNTAAVPSPRVQPEADASKVRQRPELLSSPEACSSIQLAGDRSTEEPKQQEKSVAGDPSRRTRLPSAPRLTAQRPAAPPASRATLGPLSPRAKLTLPARMDAARPVAEKEFSLDWINPHSF
mmetsp:Transcript_47317/g.151892  ORF Transcript_47317/g.151892 Transcript_47317/m.151892 type:complete len:244 (-) Transcript_47317:1028-1759(-)